jgi:nitrogen fixation NifU-like protein
MEDQEYYLERLKENYQNPQNVGELKDYDFYGRFKNPTCGDNFEIYIKIKDNVVEDVKFKGEGCAISTASMSLVSEYLKGKIKEELNNIDKEKVLDILHIPISPGRLNCALMPMNVIKNALKKNESN